MGDAFKIVRATLDLLVDAHQRSASVLLHCSFGTIEQWYIASVQRRACAVHVQILLYILIHIGCARWAIVCTLAVHCMLLPNRAEFSVTDALSVRLSLGLLDHRAELSLRDGACSRNATFRRWQPGATSVGRLRVVVGLILAQF